MRFLFASGPQPSVAVARGRCPRNNSSRRACRSSSARLAADTPDAALKLLTEGNERYVANQPRERDFSAGRASRALGQAPFAAILGCADFGSRPSWLLIKDQEICLLFALQAIS